jgi:hypothetical protein
MAKRIERVPNTAQMRTLAKDSGAPDVVNVPVKVVSETDGPVTTAQKLKKYYKGIIVFVGSIGVSLAAIVPEVSDDWKKVIGGIILGTTVLGVILKKNEDWVENL